MWTTTVVQRHLGARGEAFGQPVKAPPLVGGGITVHQRGLEGEAHRAHLHLHLGGAGLRALQVNDRAVHVHVAAEQVHGF